MGLLDKYLKRITQTSNMLFVVRGGSNIENETPSPPLRKNECCIDKTNNVLLIGQEDGSLFCYPMNHLPKPLQDCLNEGFVF